jgi:hypothetical protein
MVTATTSNPVFWFPLLGKKVLVEPQGLFIISVSFFTSIINRVLVGMVFLGNDVKSFILKEMRSVNLKVLISKFKTTFHIFRELTCIQTQERLLFSISYGLKTPIIWKSTYFHVGCNAL